MLSRASQSKDSTIRERSIGRALLIIAYGVSTLPQDGIAIMEEKLKLKIEDEVQVSFTSAIQACFSSNNIENENKAELFDVCLQALAQIWLIYPAALSKTLKDRDIIFDLIMQALESSDQSTNGFIKPQTKARMVVTFTNYLLSSRKDERHEHNPDFISFLINAMWTHLRQ